MEEPRQTSVESLDKFSRPPPGHSLTGPKGKWSWEQAPRFADPEEAIDFVIDKIETPTVENDMLSMMVAGMSIEEIVDGIAISGFATGHYSPDVAELIKAPIAMYLAGLAIENDVPPKMFNTQDGMPNEEGNVDEDQVRNIMQDRSPESLQVMAEAQGEEEAGMAQTQQLEEESFLAPSLDEAPAPEVEEIV